MTTSTGNQDGEKQVSGSSEVQDEKPNVQAVEYAPASRIDEEFQWTIGKFIAVTSIWMPFAMDILYVAAIGSLLTVINNDIGPQSSYSWIVTSFAIGSATVSPLVGRLGDIFGRRPFILLGNVFSGVGGIVGATANSINTLIGAGCLIGVGVALHQLSFASVSELVPKRSRGISLGVMEGALAPVTAFATLIGYSLAEYHSWRDVYWIIFAVNAGSFVLIFFYYRPMNQYIKEEGRTRFQQVQHLDWIGFLLFLAGLVLFLLGISFGGTQFPWKSAGTIVPIIVGFLLLVACGLWEAYMPLEYPLFPPVVFKNIRGFTLVNVGVFLIGILYYACLVVWPEQISSLYTQNPITIGWYATAFGFGSIPFAILSGLAVRKTGGLQWWFRGAVVGITLISGVQAIVTPSSSVASTALVALCGGLVSSSTVVSTMIIQISVPHEYLGIATAIVASARSVGGAVGTTIYVVILQARLATNLTPDVAIPLAKAGLAAKSIPAVIEALLIGDATSPILATLTIPQLETAVLGLKWAFAHALRTVYLSSIAFGGIGIICSAFVANVDHLMTRTIDIKLEEGAHVKGHTDTGEGHFIKRVGEDVVVT